MQVRLGQEGRQPRLPRRLRQGARPRGARRRRGGPALIETTPSSVSRVSKTGRPRSCTANAHGVTAASCGCVHPAYCYNPWGRAYNTVVVFAASYAPACFPGSYNVYFQTINRIRFAFRRNILCLEFLIVRLSVELSRVSCATEKHPGRNYTPNAARASATFACALWSRRGST